MMPMGGFAPVAAQAEDDDDVVQQKVQTSFTVSKCVTIKRSIIFYLLCVYIFTRLPFQVKLMKFDEKQKVALIKEIKTLLEGMNLVQAKKFVESAPAVVKTDIAKDEAEKLKEALSKVGATIEIE